MQTHPNHSERLAQNKPRSTIWEPHPTTNGNPTLSPLVYRAGTRSPMSKIAWQTRPPAQSHQPPRCSFYRLFQSSSELASSRSFSEPGSSPSDSQPYKQDY